MQRLSHNQTGQQLWVLRPDLQPARCQHHEAGSTVNWEETALISGGEQKPTNTEIETEKAGRNLTNV